MHWISICKFATDRTVPEQSGVAHHGRQEQGVQWRTEAFDDADQICLAVLSCWSRTETHHPRTL